MGMRIFSLWTGIIGGEAYRGAPCFGGWMFGDVPCCVSAGCNSDVFKVYVAFLGR